jgi:putative hemolysin
MVELYYVALLVCLLLVALLAASEAALAATNRVRLRHLLQAQAQPNHASAEDHTAAQILSSELSGDAQRFIATVTVAANVPLLLASAFAMLIARNRFGDSPVVIAICALLAFVAIALFQVTPRLLVSQPGALDRLWWVRPARLLVSMMRPPVTLCLMLGMTILRPLGLAPSRQNMRRDESDKGAAEEIRDLVESAQASGVIEEEGKELIESIFTFGDTRVHEVMIPRPDILALPQDCSPDIILDTLQESGFSRIPLHEGSVDRIAGILHAKDVLGALSRGEVNFDPKALMRPAIYLPESKMIDEAFATMRAARTHLAIVIDEYGGTAGLLTVEDILEELVGEIADEHDRREEAPLQIIDASTAVADALLHADDLEEQWSLELPTGEFDTIGGFMIEQLGRALVVGDRVELADAVLTVQSVRGRRPKKILIRKISQAAGKGSES